MFWSRPLNHSSTSVRLLGRNRLTIPTTILLTKAVAALLCKQLDSRFPGVKFSVRRSTGTAAAWTNVHHEDGPTNAQVDDVCRPAAAH